MAEVADIVLGGSTDPLRRVAQVRRRALAVHVVPAAVVSFLLAGMEGGDDGSGVRWTIVGVVAACVVPQVVGLWFWARWAWAVGTTRPGSAAARAATTRQELARVIDLRTDRILTGFARTAAAASCWWLEIIGLAVAVTTSRSSDALLGVPTWMVVNTVCPAMLLYGLAILTAFRVVTRWFRLRLGYRLAELLAPARVRRTGPGRRPKPGRAFPGGR